MKLRWGEPDQARRAALTFQALVFPHYDKNRVDLDFPLDEALTKLIDEYVHEFRPTLLPGWNAAWLFPGVAGETKTASMFSTQITQRIQRGRVMTAFSRLTDEAIVLRRLGHSEGH